MAESSRFKALPAALALDPERMTRFEREARLLASLDHPSIGAIYGLEESDGKELFFRQGTKIMAAPIRLTKTSVEGGKPQALFEVPLIRFQVSRDGQRFLIALPVEGATASAPLTVDTDWRAGISK